MADSRWKFMITYYNVDGHAWNSKCIESVG